MNDEDCRSLALVGLIASSASVAQVMPWKMTTNSVSYRINSYLPYEADAPTDRGAATWTNVGSRLVFSNGGLTGTEDVSQSSSTDVPGVQIQSRPTSYYPSSSNWSGIAVRTAATSTTTSDADIVVNADKIAAGAYYYGTGTPPSGQSDYESMIVHEFGHVAGFDHDVNSSAYCIMKPTIVGNQVWRTPCSTEVTGLKNKYGVTP
jgi:hypothetical protein